MAKRKVKPKVEKKKFSVNDLQAKLFDAALSGKLEIDSYNNRELWEAFNKYKESVRIEVPAFTATLQELADLADNCYDEPDNLLKSMAAARAMSKDLQKQLEYHENELQRHAKAYDAIMADIKQVSDRDPNAIT